MKISYPGSLPSQTRTGRFWLFSGLEDPVTALNYFLSFWFPLTLRRLSTIAIERVDPPSPIDPEPRHICHLMKH